MPDSFRRFSYRLLAIGVCAVLLASAFWVGFELGHGRFSSVVSAEVVALKMESRALAEERDVLRDALAAAKREQTILERDRQIDREAARALTDQLKEAQDARLALNRELSYLKRLVQEGGRGAIRVQDLRLRTGGAPMRFQYSFTLSQLVPGFGESVGRARLEIEGRDDDGAVTLALRDLPGADPRELPVAFEHFQTLSGTFEIPDGFEPLAVVILVEPSNDLLMPMSETFPWAPQEESTSSAVPLEDEPPEGARSPEDS
jgi:uncharacterized membrane protein